MCFLGVVDLVCFLESFCVCDLNVFLHVFRFSVCVLE